MPLSLTLLAAAVPAARRAMAIGIWGGVSGLGVALGPVIGGAVVDGISWEAIFWINVPVAVVAVPLDPAGRCPSRTADASRSTCPGSSWPGPASSRSCGPSPAATTTAGASARVVGGAASLGVLLARRVPRPRARTDYPLVPLRLFRVRSFAVANASALAFSFGVFGLVFLLAQYLQIGDGLHPAGGRQSGRCPGRRHPCSSRRSQACSRPGSASARCSPRGSPCRPAGWRGSADRSSTDGLVYVDLVPGLALAGIGMGLTFAPSATAVLFDMAPDDHGTASSVNATIREIGGALGVAALVAVFTAADGTLTPDGYVAGLQPAALVAAVGRRGRGTRRSLRRDAPRHRARTVA